MSHKQLINWTWTAKARKIELITRCVTEATTDM